MREQTLKAENKKYNITEEDNEEQKQNDLMSNHNYNIN